MITFESTGGSIPPPPAANTTTYCFQGLIGSEGYNATESIMQIARRTPGTLSRLYVYVGQVAGTSPVTITLRKNATSGNSTVSVPASTIGEFIDTVDSDEVISGDLVDYQFVTGAGTAGIPISNVAMLFTPLDQSFTVCRTGNCGASTTGGGTGNNITGTAPIYAVLVGTGGDANSGGLAGVSHYGKSTQVLSNLFINASANTRSQAVTICSMINGTQGDVSVSVAAGTNGTFEDLVGTDDIFIGTLYAVGKIPGSDTGNSVTIVPVAFELMSTNNSSIWSAGDNGLGLLPATVAYVFPIQGGLGAQSVSAAHDKLFQFSTGIAVTASMLDVLLYQNTLVTVGTVRLRLNTMYASPSISIPASTSGRFIDTVDSVDIGPTDQVDLTLLTGLGLGHEYVFSVMGVLITPTSLGMPSYVQAADADFQWLGGDEY